MAQTAGTIFRDFVTDGVPSSGAHQPRKADIREWGTHLEQILAGAQAGGGVVFQTKAAMTLGHAANQMAWVIADPIAANNGIYQKQGGSGSGAWVRVGDLPYSFIKALNTGDGTANAIEAKADVPIPAADGGALINFNVVTDNTGSPVTVSFNGGVPLVIKTNAGFDPEPGALSAGMVAAGFKVGGTFRLLTDNLSSAILAAMHTEASRAEEASDHAQDAADHAAGQAVLAASEAEAARAAALSAQGLVVAATAGFSGFDENQSYDFGYVKDAATYFDQDWGLIAGA